MKFEAFLWNEALILSLKVLKYLLVIRLIFVSNSLYIEVWQVFSTVYPEPYCSLDLENNRNQYLLNHLWILYSFRISENLLNGWVNFWSLWLYELKMTSQPCLNYSYWALIIHLVNFLVHFSCFGSLYFHSVRYYLDLSSRVMFELYHWSKQLLNDKCIS